MRARINDPPMNSLSLFVEEVCLMAAGLSLDRRSAANTLLLSTKRKESDGGSTCDHAFIHYLKKKKLSDWLKSQAFRPFDRSFSF